MHAAENLAVKDPFWCNKRGENAIYDLGLNRERSQRKLLSVKMQRQENQYPKAEESERKGARCPGRGKERTGARWDTLVPLPQKKDTKRTNKVSRGTAGQQSHEQERKGLARAWETDGGVCSKKDVGGPDKTSPKRAVGNKIGNDLRGRHWATPFLKTY